MLAIKLVRFGKKNLPSFRVAVTDGNKVVEFLGSYYPHSKAAQFVVSKELLEKWLKSGARPTAAVGKLIKGKYEFQNYVPKKAEETTEAAPPAPSAEAPVPEKPAEEAPAEVEAEAPAEEPKPPEEAQENA